MEGFLNPISIVLHMINAAILLGALYFLLLKPVRRFMNARTDSIQKQLDQVATAKAGLDQERQLAQQDVLAARKTAADTMSQSVARADDQAQKLLEEAHTNAENILSQARSEAEQMRQSAREDMRGEVAGLSVALAGKLLKREVTPQDHEKLIEEFLKKVV